MFKKYAYAFVIKLEIYYHLYKLDTFLSWIYFPGTDGVQHIEVSLYYPTRKLTTYVV